MNKVLENIKSRRSFRKYKPDQIKDQELEAILEAGRFAPSAINQQPWFFTVIQNKKLMDEMSEKTKEALRNSEVERFREYGNNEKYHVFYHAPTIVVLSCRSDAHSPLMDISAAIQNMLLAAESLNLGSCWIGLVTGYLFKPDMETWRKKLELPEGYDPVFAVCLGYKNTDVQFNAPERNPNVVNYIR